MERLDEILGGGIREGLNVALIGSFDEDNLLLMHQMAYNLLKSGHRILVAEFRQAPDVLKEWLSYYGIKYDDYIENGRLKILDGFTNLYSSQPVRGEGIIPNPRDLGITAGIIQNELTSGNYDVLIIDDLTVLYALHSDKDAYIRVIIRFINSIKKLGRQVFAGINSEVTEKGDLAKLLLPFEYVIEVANGRIKPLRSYYPLRLPAGHIPYRKTENGLESTWDSYLSLQELKNSLYLDDEGNLWSGSDKVQIINEESEASLIEFVYHYLGPGEGRKFLYLWGRYEFRGVGEAYKNIHESLRAVLEDIAASTETSGGGRLEIVQLEDDLVVLRGRNLFPRIKGFKHPAHVNYAGEIAQLLEEYTGEKWEGDETRCQAMGHNYCEFVFRRKVS
ncbi:V4R domain-containing protein [Thermococcus pacificus]|uniref:4-vinyl reductase 4VR domain-containing protein n=1 Tax=Thermococcus pacificus TaxID=71998 RepID=A0A218P8Z2_9EURY|nr:V4R domain-containing protein [Thermococcus pacificus]ASJ07261.1 hypothetical protein A3L08_07970 [Thermococcus pacificus]